MLALLISILIAFLITFIITPQFIKFLSSAGIIGLDLQKKNRPKLPTSGGIY